VTVEFLVEEVSYPSHGDAKWDDGNDMVE